MSIMSSYYNTTVVWEVVTQADDGWGDPVVTTQTVAARVDPANKVVRNREGQEVVSRAVVRTDAAISAGDWLTLSDGTRQQAIDVRVKQGLAAEEYREVYL